MVFRTETPAVLQTLFVIPETINGVPLFGFGLLLGVWVLFSIGLVATLGIKNGFNGDTLSYLPVLGLVAAAIVFLLPNIVEESLGGLPIRGYGVMLLLGTVSGVGLAAYRARTMGLDPEIIYSLAFVMFIFGILGARVWYVIQYFEQFQKPTLAATIQSLFGVTNGGLVVYGSVIGGLGAGIVFAIRRKLPMLALADIIAPSMVIGLAFGRIGCLFNGCCYGGICEVDWAPSLEFPQHSPPYEHQLQTGLYHGVRWGPDDEGYASVRHIEEGAITTGSDLKVGDRITQVILDPRIALRVLESAHYLRGKAVKVQTNGNKIHTLEIPDVGGSSESRLGIEATDSFPGPVIDSVQPKSYAAAAGIKAGDKITRVVFPPDLKWNAQQEILAYAGPTLAVATARKTFADLSQQELPKKSLPVHPTQIYSAVNAALLAAFLWFFYPFRKRDGEVFTILLMVYPIGRILLEAIRTDVDGIFGTAVTPSQAMSIVFILLGGCLWIYLRTRPAELALPRNTPEATS